MFFFLGKKGEALVKSPMKWQAIVTPKFRLPSSQFVKHLASPAELAPVLRKLWTVTLCAQGGRFTLGSSSPLSEVLCLQEHSHRHSFELEF